MKLKKPMPEPMPNIPYGEMGIPPIVTDPFGSYTGVPEEFGELPVQDADDL